MSWIVRLMKSSLGAKYVMAITGLGLFLFLIGHVAGNLLLYVGQSAMNEYAAGLRKLPYGLLWVARLGLLVAFGLHIYTAYYLTLKNRAARPVPYQNKAYMKASTASRSMALTGTAVFLFLLYHLAHYTFRIVNNTGEQIDPAGLPDVYAMVVQGFQQPLISIIYIAAMLVLGFHLHHGVSSAFQSLGLNHNKYNPMFRKGFPAISWVVVLAGASIPLAVLSGFIK